MKFSLLFIFFVFVLTSCKKVDFDKISDNPWNPQLGAPLLDAEFSVGDIISKMDSSGNVGFLNNVVTLSYSTTLDTLSIDSLLITNPIKENKLIEFPIQMNQTISNNVGPVELETAFKFDFGQNKISKIEFKSGELVLNITTEIPHGFRFIIKIPSLQKNNQPFQKEMMMMYQSKSTNSVELRIPLEGYTLDLDPENNEFKIHSSTTLITSGKASTSNSLNIGINLSNYGISYAEGKFGGFSENLKDSVEISLIKNATSSEFGLTNPRVKFSIENSFGFPIAIALNDIKSRDNETNKITPISINNTIKSQGITNRNSAASIDKILISNSNIPEPGYTTIQANGLNQLISSREKTLYYSITPSANQTNSTAFITDKSYLIIKATAELPLEGYASNLEINDTLDFKIDDSDELKLDYLEIKLLAINKFPLDVKGSLLLLDENKSIIRNSLNQPLDLLNLKNQNLDLTNVLNAGLTDANGNVIEGSTTALTFLITKENMNNFKKAKFIKIIGKLNVGSSSKPIKLTESNSLKLQLGIKTSVKPSLK